MNLSQSPLRRLAGLAAGAVLGLAGVAVAASPAYATDAVIGKASYCDKATGEWVVDWTVKGNAPDGVEKFRFTEVKSEVGFPVKATTLPEYTVTEDFKYSTNEDIKAQQRVAGDKNFARLSVKVLFDNKHPVEASNTENFDGTCKKESQPSPSPSTSASPAPSQSPSTPAEEIPGDAEPIFELTCDTMTFGLSIPENGITIDLHYKTSKGEERDVSIAPGESKSETFSATEGFSVDVTVSATEDGETYSETLTLDYEQPADCEDGNGGGLPVTGAAAGGVAGGAAALLVAGGALFFVARRRKVKFTA
ncbi:LPXTG cell wall anchor domain-containing protein [Actinoplanes sp. NBC_00393]|uniref:LPXTG cell wall anchor domain-containing protein n=1 Tax=Actinoplanes sp. NBC_00393 TaxID=2975953 RepID=UPI002E215596